MVVRAELCGNTECRWFLKFVFDINDDTGTCLSWFFAEEGVMTESIFDLHAHMERERLLGSSLAMYKRMMGEFYAEYVIQVLP